METQKVIFRNLVDIPSTTHATYGLYRYPAKFIPHVVAYVLKNYAKPGMRVFDPFGGYGTVGVVSRVYGHEYELWDLNPIIEILHSVAILRPVEIDIRVVLKNFKGSNQEFVPLWSRHKFWFRKEFLPFLYHIWGHYHSLHDRATKLILTIPLLKTTRYFSFDDMQRQKLSKSKRSEERVSDLLKCDWKNVFLEMLGNEIHKVVKGIREYSMLSPKDTSFVVKGGVDSLSETLTEDKDVLITSPPYLQSQEYLRQAKLDLYWLGYSEETIKSLSKLEIPYRKIGPCHIYSDTFLEYRDKIEQPHVQKMFDQYFWGVLGALTNLQQRISSYLFLFVGHSSARGHSIPIDRIFTEHLTQFGWKHERTLVDTIVSRRLFTYNVNPASRIIDKRTATENLVVLRRI